MGGRAQQHAMRNLFRVDDDSSSSSGDDDDNDEVDGKGQSNMTLSHSASSQQPSTLTTVTQRIQHVELEMCTVGGSIEHRLWPAATFLTSYMLADNNDRCHHSRHHSSIADLTNQKIHQNVQTILDHFRYIVATNSTKSVSERKGLKVLELGAGIGFTSLELAYHVFHKGDNNQTNHILEFLMTDLSSALPLLQRNQQRNFGTQNSSSIRVQKLEWGNHDDIENAISWCRNIDTNHNDNETPLLILGTDCVYWESLHDILETTIALLLQNATPNSICLLANVRRWKRDTNFFQHKFGQFTSNQYGRLHCTCIHEQVARNTVMNVSSIDDPDDNSIVSARETALDNNYFGHQQEQREVIRIYAVQWITKDSKQQKVK